MKKQAIDLEDFDFGFCAVDEDELSRLTGAGDIEKEAEQWKDVATKMYNMIMPLMNNLAKNEEKDYIYWPNRAKKIEDFKNKIESVYNLQKYKI
jgi:hypothetical protein